jgi:lipopolysaccharide/colanic/teichoic acid biosynthesis glycosyltransferase
MSPRQISHRFLALLLLVLCCPLFLGIPILIWLDDGPPIFFTQLRSGKHGEPFSIFKFRTLTTAAEGTSAPSEHTTRVGVLLRRWGLDELPQLWNVVRGEMVLIGPRPVLPAEARGYDDHAQRRLDVQPGLTGWAQIQGRNRLNWTERLTLDLWYVEHQSLGLDLRILAQTPLVLLSGKGVYGPGTDDPSTSDVHSDLSSRDA